jgi:hypothetical protein
VSDRFERALLLLDDKTQLSLYQRGEISNPGLPSGITRPFQ